MRTDLILRYLTTSVDKLDLVRRHLQGEFSDQKSTVPENNRIIKEYNSAIDDTEKLIATYLETLQTELDIINKELKRIKG